MAENLNTISAPVLNGQYGQNIEETFTNIDENFKFLDSKDINKGENGTGVISLNIPFSKLLNGDNSFTHEGYQFEGQLSNFTQMFVDVKIQLTNNHEITTGDVDVQRSIQCLKKSGRSICVLFDEPAPEATGIIQIKSTIPYVFKDDSFIKEYEEHHSIEYDLSGVISYDYNFIETNPWNCKQLFPTLYYNSGNESLYWVIDGANTTIPAQGPSGVNGKDGALWVGLVNTVPTPIQGETSVTITKLLIGSEWVDVSSLDSSQVPTQGSPILLLPEYANRNNNDLTSYAISTIIVNTSSTVSLTSNLTNDNILYAKMTSGEFINCMCDIINHGDNTDGRHIPGYFFRDKEGNSGYIFFREGNQLKLRKVTNVNDPSTKVTTDKVYRLIIDGDVNLNIGEGNLTSESNPVEALRGTNSLAVGRDAHAYGNVSQAFGQNTTASGQYSHAEGDGTTASGLGSHAEGSGSTAYGDYSHVEGYSTEAFEQYSHAEGYSTEASGEASHAEGDNVHAHGHYSHAEGSGTFAAAEASHAEGIGTRTTENFAEGSHAEGAAENGGIIKACTIGSHAEGHATGNNSKILSGDPTHTSPEGGNHAEGLASNGGEIIAKNGGAHAGGEASGGSSEISAISPGAFAHGMAESGSSGEGRIIASGVGSFAHGYANRGIISASGVGSHAEGQNTTASGYYSHAEGNITTASGVASHAEGNGTIASGVASHAEGLGRDSFYIHLVGGTGATTYTLSAGGDINDLKPGYLLKYNGITAEITNVVEYARYISVSRSLGRLTVYDSVEVICDGARGRASHKEGSSNITTGDYSHVGGENSSARGTCSFAHGDEVVAGGASSFATGWGTITVNPQETAVGMYNETGEFYIKQVTGSNGLTYGYIVGPYGSYKSAGELPSGCTLYGWVLFSVGIGYNFYSSAEPYPKRRNQLVVACPNYANNFSRPGVFVLSSWDDSSASGKNIYRMVDTHETM